MTESKSAEEKSPGAAQEVEEVLPRQFGKYTLLRRLAAGGMAQLYLAIQRAVAGFEKLVVIKQILPALTRDAEFVAMLLSEARTAATLNHPNVVQTFDVGEVDGVYYIAMEHIHGEDIRAIVRAMRGAKVASFPLEHTLSMVLGVCAGLAYAHEKRGIGGELLQIVHRDISPQNILVTHSGDVKVVDFGIAKSTEVIGAENSAAGQLKGKVPYMSPEQARGELVDHRSDIFAVGILLFELTTGRRLFKAKSDYDTLRLICDRKYPNPADVVPSYPPGLACIVTKALAKDPAQRYQSARDMQAEIEAFVREERIAASSVSLGQWMAMLFADKIEQQKLALHDAKQLADVIAQQQSDMVDLYASGALGGTTGGATTFDSTGTGTGIRARPSAPWYLWAAAAATVVLVGLGVVAGVMRSRPAPQPAVVQPAVETKKKGSIVVASIPEGAYIRVAGELQGVKTPATLEDLPLGIELEIKLSLEGFEDHISKIELSDEERRGELSTKLVRGTVTFEYEVTPKSAKLSLDGKKHDGESSRLEELSTGKHKAVFSAPGHASKTIEFDAKRGETKRVEVVLPKLGGGPAGGKQKTPAKAGGRGTVNVASRGGYCSNVIIGGRSVGPSPVAGVSVPAGPVGIVCKLPDGRSIGSGTVVKDGKTARVTIRIPKK